MGLAPIRVFLAYTHPLLQPMEVSEVGMLARCEHLLQS
jgi:hypothetical protein